MMPLALSLLAIAPVGAPPPASSQSAVQQSPAASSSAIPPATQTASQADTTPPVSTTFRTRKGIAQLEKCLTDRLSKVGEVTSVPIEGMKTLMYSTTDEPPMMINIDPPSVIVTTKFAIGTQPIVKGCL